MSQPREPLPTGDAARANPTSQVADLEDRVAMLEQEVVRRGVKLNCANIALSRAKIAFERAAERRDALVMEVSHDLRTPLTAVIGAADNLIDGIAGPLGEDQREYLEMMRDQAVRLQNAVSWLVDNLRLAASPLQFADEPVDLGELVAGVVRRLSPIAETDGLRLELEVAGGIESICDPDKLIHVVENIVGNAIKFTDESGEVSVSLQRFGDHATLKVRDTGVGMAPEEIERVFDRFYRGQTNRSGTGLGLSISREMMQLHGGDICVTSEQGVGSEFTVRIPLTPV